VQAKLKAGTIKLGAGDLPKLLWEGETFDPDNMFKGFMKGDVLKKVCLPILLCLLLIPGCTQAALHIMIGPSAANNPAGSRSARAGNAAIHDIRKITVYFLAYLGVLVSPVPFPVPPLI
jgi:hypothetical protein